MEPEPASPVSATRCRSVHCVPPCASAKVQTTAAVPRRNSSSHNSPLSSSSSAGVNICTESGSERFGQPISDCSESEEQHSAAEQSSTNSGSALSQASDATDHHATAEPAQRCKPDPANVLQMRAAALMGYLPKWSRRARGLDGSVGAAGPNLPLLRRPARCLAGSAAASSSATSSKSPAPVLRRPAGWSAASSGAFRPSLPQAKRVRPGPALCSALRNVQGQAMPMIISDED